ncbi:unnamed protein product [Phyllotreta striolata]|uniref:Major facilitator superfamily (MFS) profile domain-containing protein n=1 Tax=Phyllotreta striolata TaxID=444603 RepID=A0A9N9TEH1_PHYSR|nr:unnamed protein product [Phyllotreta striolata]
MEDNRNNLETKPLKFPSDKLKIADENRNVKRSQKASETSEFEAPDGGYGWVIVAASFLAIMVVDGVINSFGIFLSYLKQEFDSTDGIIAWVGSILAGVTLLVGPLASALTNKYGCRATCIIGSLLTTAALCLSVFCTNVISLMSTYFIAGIGLGLIQLPAIVFVGYYFESKRALATGISMSGSGFGTFVFPPIIAYILRTSDWKMANAYLAACALCCTVFGALMKPLKLKAPPPETEYHQVRLTKNEESKSAVDVSIVTPKKQRKPVENLGQARNRSQSNVTEYFAFKRHYFLTRKEIFYTSSVQLNVPIPREKTTSFKSILDLTLLKDRIFLLFCILNILSMISLYIPLVYIVDYAKSNVGNSNFVNSIEDGKASFLISIIGIVNIVARIVFGYIVNFPTVSSLTVNNICLFIGAAAITLLPYCQTFITCVFASVFFGLSIAAYSSLSLIILIDLVGMGQVTNCFGITQLFRGVSTLIGTPLGGVMLNWAHSYSVPFFVSGGLFFLSALFGIIVQHLHNKSSDTVNVGSV